MCSDHADLEMVVDELEEERSVMARKCVSTNFEGVSTSAGIHL